MRRRTTSALVTVVKHDVMDKGVKIYWGTTSRIYSSVYDIGLTLSYRVTGLQRGRTYYFSSKAYNANGTSDYGNEIVHTA